jgi:hypothetical protein
VNASGFDPQNTGACPWTAQLEKARKKFMSMDDDGNGVLNGQVRARVS